jgi:hypothetical protein
MNLGKLLKGALSFAGKALVDGLLRMGEKRLGQQIKGK